MCTNVFYLKSDIQKIVLKNKLYHENTQYVHVLVQKNICHRNYLYRLMWFPWFHLVFEVYFDTMINK